jgi:hypothetical protein
MSIEQWGLVGLGLIVAIGFGVITVLLLGLHSEVRRLQRLARLTQRAIVDGRQTNGPKKSPPIRAQAALPLEVAADSPIPLAQLSAATADPPHTEEIDPPPGPVAPPSWHPDRRLLVMRLASRGRNAEQIASALHIPEDEVQQFLESSRLMAKRTGPL